MADDTYQSSPDERDPGGDVALDDSDELTPEDHLAKMKLALLANEAMRREEQSLGLGPSGAPMGIPTAAPPQLPQGVGVNPVPGPVAPSITPPPGPGPAPIMPAQTQASPVTSPDTITSRGGFSGPNISGGLPSSGGALLTPLNDSLPHPFGREGTIIPNVPGVGGSGNLTVTGPNTAIDDSGKVHVFKPNQPSASTITKPMTEAQRASLEEEKREFDLKQKSASGTVKMQPRWIPKDPATGAPGHFETGAGAVHIPAQERANRDPVLQGDITALRSKIGKVEESVVKGDLTEEQGKALVDKYQSELDDKKAQYYGTDTGTTPSPKASGPQTKRTATGGKGKLSKDGARLFLKQAGGDKDKARKLALEAGYTL